VKTAWRILLPGFLVLIFFSAGITLSVTNSNNDDERAHITAGYAYLVLNDYSFNREHPPLLKQLSALPLILLDLSFPMDIYNVHGRKDISMEFMIGQRFLYEMGNDLDRMLLYARIPNILIGALLGIFVFLYSRRLNGFWAGVLSLSLFAVSPNFIAHSSLVTTDTAVACFFFLTVYFLWRYFSTLRDRYIILCGLSFGFTLVSKYNGLIMIPILYMLVPSAVFLFFNRGKSPGMRIRLSPVNLALAVLFALTVSAKWSTKAMVPAVVLTVLAYLIPARFSSREKVHFSGKILLFLLIIGFTIAMLDYTDLKGFPFHCPTKSYFEGFASFRGHSIGGHDAYLLGRFSSGGWWYYFPAAMFFKTPVASLVLMILGFFALVKKKETLKNSLFFTLPPVVYLLVACFVNNVNIGVRHVLAVYPFLFVVAGYCVSLFSGTSYKKIFNGILFLLVGLVVLSSIYTFPGCVSFINELAGGYRNGYKYLGDSNISWGMDLKRLKKYLDDNNIIDFKIRARFIPGAAPAYYGVPAFPITSEEEKIPGKGVYIIDSSQLYMRDILWLDKVKPEAYIGGSLLVYRIDEKDRERITGSY